VSQLPTIVTLSLSEIASSMINRKLRPLQAEALGSVLFIDLDIKGIKTRFHGNASAVLLNFPIWSPEFSMAISSMRDKGYQGQMVALVQDAKKWSREIQRRPEILPISILEKPFSNLELIGLVRRLLALPTTNFRAHPRFELQQNADLYYNQGRTFKSCELTNVSRGGACLQFTGEPPVSKGQEITLTVGLDGQAAPQTLVGKVAWMKPTQSLIGVQFLTA
jgi:hypothetical protein